MGCALRWLCGEDTPSIKDLLFAYMLPKKTHFLHTKRQDYRECQPPRWLELRDPAGQLPFYLGGHHRPGGVHSAVT